MGATHTYRYISVPAKPGGGTLIRTITNTIDVVDVVDTNAYYFIVEQWFDNPLRVVGSMYKYIPSGAGNAVYTSGNYTVNACNIKLQWQNGANNSWLALSWITNGVRVQ